MISETISASLLRRLAEAADGYRTGNPVWIAASYNFPHDAEVFLSEMDAKNYIQKTNGYGVFGPYVTLSDSSPHIETDRSQIKEINIVVEKNGKKEIIKIDPIEMDALFWSISSIDKFVFPYYSHVYGVTMAAKMRQDLLDSETVIYGHTDGTRWLPTR